MQGDVDLTFRGMAGGQNGGGGRSARRGKTSAAGMASMRGSKLTTTRAKIRQGRIIRAVNRF